MEGFISLSELPINAGGRIISVRSGEPQLRRLSDLGFIPGAPVQKLMTAAAGDPSAYRICGCVIALRAADAASIRVRTDVGRESV